MILTCPACDTRYSIDASKIGRDGRTVRCKACRHTWHAEAGEQKPIELAVAAKPERPRAEDLQAVKPSRLPAKYRELLEDKKRLRALAAQGMVWAGLAVSMAVVLACAFVFRVDVIRTMPALAGAYQSVGIKVNPTGLELQNYTAEAALKGGRFVVRVQAKVKNLRSVATPVPPVRVKLYNADQSVFDTRTIASGGLIVAPGETRTLVFDVADPSNLTSALDLGFDLVALKDSNDHATPSHPVAVSPVAPLRDTPGGVATTDQAAPAPAARPAISLRTEANDTAHDTHAQTTPSLRDAG
jgi:predicted Zn finger-like uncharacterized protein